MGSGAAWQGKENKPTGATMKTSTITTSKCLCGQEAEIHVITKICQMCGYSKNGKLIILIPETWQEKAEWLRIHGHPLTIHAYSIGEIANEKWQASIAGEGIRYASTIPEAIEQVYKWVIKEIYG